MRLRGIGTRVETLEASTVIRMPGIFVSKSDTNKALYRAPVCLAETRLASMALG
jgi:hypothetical protein